MCDTLVALSNSTRDGSVIFGKNSDRPNDEVQLITHVPSQNHQKGDLVRCTYIEIPQVSKTYAVLLSQPFWLWGAEMGANEHGVVIGNEAVHTHEPLRRTGLLGMDLLRLGLERGKNAFEAVKVISELLEIHHQGGGCAFGDSGWTYHNSFIAADDKEAYVLETADDWWIVEKVRGVRSISNGISIRGKGDMRRDGIIQHAIEQGYCESEETFDFAVTFSGSAPSKSPYSRWGKSSSLLEKNKGKITAELMMSFLREHDAGICMHGGFESTGSQVSHLRTGKTSMHWFTGTTLPCLSSYKPYAFPTEGQFFEKPGPFSTITDEWVWVQHARNKSRRMASNSQLIEKKTLSRVNELIKMEDDISKNKFIERIRIINQKSWKNTRDLFS